MIIALDPGPELTAWVRLVDDMPVEFGHEENGLVRALLHRTCGIGRFNLAVEMIASYGMPVGAEVFQTCVEIGRFIEIAPFTVLIKRLEVKSHLCHSAKANDASIRQALIDRYGPGKDRAIGKKAAPGPLFGISGDVWAALAVAVTFSDRLNTNQGVSA